MADLAPWCDQGRALRPDQEPFDSSCGSQLLPTIDGDAAPVCAAACAAFVGLVGATRCEMGIDLGGLVEEWLRGDEEEIMSGGSELE